MEQRRRVPLLEEQAASVAVPLNSSKMSTQNTSTVQTVESLRAALSQAQALVSQLENALAAAEEVAATEAVLAMVETAEEPIPAEPVPFFGSADGLPIGPCDCSGKFIVPGVESDREFKGGFSGHIRAYAGGSDGPAFHWTAFLYSDAVTLPGGALCESFGDWAGAVRWLRAQYAKYSARVVAKAA